MHLIEVCVGSSCHLKGSYEVELKGCFCLGECKEGVSVRVDDVIFTSITKDNARAFFIDHFIAKK
jgi:NADH:ubiquinone oxidoreductase subunit E